MRMPAEEAAIRRLRWSVHSASSQASMSFRMTRCGVARGPHAQLLTGHDFGYGEEGLPAIIEPIATMPLKPFAAPYGPEKKIFLLKPRGFCAGVVRAIDV